MDDDSQKPIKGKPFLAASLLSFLVGASWMFYFGDAWLGELLKAHWQTLFGTEWFKAPDWLSVSVFVGTILIPAFSLFAVAAAFLVHASKLNQDTFHENNLKNLSKAHSALQQALVSFKAVEVEYKSKLQSYQQLQEQLKELATVREMDVEQLRMKLNAIAAASRRTVWIERALSFFFGVLSSVIASFVWERLNAL